MFRNYFKSAFRSLKKNKTAALINIVGLSIGISASLIIFLIVSYHYSFDTYQPGARNSYRVVAEGEGWQSANVPVPVHEMAAQSVSGLETTALFLQYNDRHAKVAVAVSGDSSPRVFKSQRGIVFADSSYFRVFPHEWLAGDAASSLREPNRLVLTESRAQEYFPGVPPSGLVGKTVVFSDTVLTTITGIVKDLEPNSDFKYQAYISLSTVSQGPLKTEYGWGDWNNVSSNTLTFVRLSAGADTAKLNRQLTAGFKAHSGSTDAKAHLYLQPLGDIHVGDKVKADTIRNLVLLGIFLLTLAGINFVNLSTAQAAERSKETGIRKTLGSEKGQLIARFLSETFLLTLVAALVSLALTPLLLKAFSGFIPSGLQIGYFLTAPLLWIFLALLIVVLSLAAGLYPAFVLTRFNAVSALKSGSRFATSDRGAYLRKSLIVFQFAAAQIFIVAVFVVQKQVRFSVGKDLGFRREAIINFNIPSGYPNPDDRKRVLRTELMKIHGVRNTSFAERAPAFNGRMTTKIKVSEQGKEQELEVDSRSGDTSFLSVYGIRLLAGRNISRADTATELLVNESLVTQLGFTKPADAINQVIRIGERTLPIVGVMRDFHLAPLRKTINPLVYYGDQASGNMAHIVLQGDQAAWTRTIEQIQSAWKDLYPDTDFEYTFLDTAISGFYKEDRQLSTLLTWCAGIAILISCLGMLGLVIFMTNKRIKEIGIRKVLGASAAQIVALLSMDFARLLVIALVIATPLAWWQMHRWLENFAYRTPMSAWIFVLSGGFLMAISITLLGIRAGSAALANPVKSLRTE